MTSYAAQNNVHVQNKHLMGLEGDHATIQKAVSILNWTSLSTRESLLLRYFCGKPEELDPGGVPRVTPVRNSSIRKVRPSGRDDKL